MPSQCLSPHYRVQIVDYTLTQVRHEDMIFVLGKKPLGKERIGEEGENVPLLEGGEEEQQ